MTPDLKTLRSVATKAARRNWTDDDMQAFDDAFRPQAVLSLLDRVEALEGALAAVHGHAQDQSGSRTFDDCSTALMWIDDLCRALNPSTGVGEAG